MIMTSMNMVGTWLKDNFFFYFYISPFFPHPSVRRKITVPGNVALFLTLVSPEETPCKQENRNATHRQQILGHETRGNHGRKHHLRRHGRNDGGVGSPQFRRSRVGGADQMTRVRRPGQASGQLSGQEGQQSVLVVLRRTRVSGAGLGGGVAGERGLEEAHPVLPRPVVVNLQLQHLAANPDKSPVHQAAHGSLKNNKKNTISWCNTNPVNNRNEKNQKQFFLFFIHKFSVHTSERERLPPRLWLISASAM